MERQLAAKEASLPNEPSPDDENVITFLVRMPDGSRRGRRFLKSHKLQVHIICFKRLSFIQSLTGLLFNWVVVSFAVSL